MAHHAIDPDTGLEFNGFVYSDTDSVKYLGDLPGLDAYNKECRERAEKAGAISTDPQGVTHYMGEYESDGTYDRFITLGAKKYAAEKHGEIEITISGVGKKEGAKELGCLENMHEGFTFYDAGGLEAVYNDKPYGDYRVDGRRIRIGTNNHSLTLCFEYLEIFNNLYYNNDAADPAPDPGI